MHKLVIAAASLMALAATPGIAKEHGKGKGHGNQGYAHGAKGCPPGLRAKGCLPPGQAKKLYGVGQRLPASFGAYNLPADYRSRYSDSRDAHYRYSDGNIYRIDPRTRVIEAVIRAVLR